MKKAVYYIWWYVSDFAYFIKEKCRKDGILSVILETICILFIAWVVCSILERFVGICSPFSFYKFIIKLGELIHGKELGGAI